MEHSQSNLTAYRHLLDSFDFSMIRTWYHTFVDYFRIKQFEKVNNIAVFLFKPYFPESTKAYSRPFYTPDLVYRPSIKLSQAKDIVYLAVFKDGMYAHYAVIMDLANFLYQHLPMLKEYALCPKCMKWMKTKDEFIVHYDVCADGDESYRK